MNSIDEIMNALNSNMSSIKKFHVKKIGVFGSFVRGEQTDTSDIDILVEFEDNQETLDNYMDLKFYLEDLFARRVDVVISSVIKEVLKKSIVESVKYAKGA
ncbi:nucleotidyltransferase family protein [Acidaminobacter hydrogenoformans]|uniref:Polymerase nucleotidyl transferase domain-containing protein n=1 Tax=Acidaminobacter hydrogenoformans DSM 2784 TaxID=1120920 RepID=A0A1G5S1L9_9FIRM|nr:nucleotidyltransferase family protein [Acidaminobacter hydrogenoformans]SCZ79459.1 hypothetical protein SAMN03080599_01770 [Acidaminobacter hydrogenoformans DSM 2784]